MSLRLSAMPEMIWKAIASFGLRFVALGLQFLGSIMIARHLGAESFGAYIFAYTCASLAGACLSLGMAELSVREVPIFAEHKSYATLKRYIQVQLSTIFAMSVVVACGFFLLDHWAILQLAPGWALVAGFALANVLVLAAEKNMAGFQRIVTARMFDSILRPALYVLAVAGFIVWGDALSPSLLLVIAIVAAVLSAVCMWGIVAKSITALRPTTDDPNTPVTSSPNDTTSNRRWWFAASIPLMLTTMVNMLMVDVDIIMLGIMLGDTEVGLYRPAVRGVALVNIANLAAVQTLGPMLARALARKDNEQAQRLLAQAVIVTSGLGIGICACLAAGGKVFLGLFGPEFLVAHSALLILVAGQAFAMLSGGAAALLVMLHQEKLVFWFNIIAIALNVGLNSLLIPLWGIEGAALSTVLSIAFIKVSFVMIIRNVSEFDPTLLFPLKRMISRS